MLNNLLLVNYGIPASTNASYMPRNNFTRIFQIRENAKKFICNENSLVVIQH